MTGIKRLLPFPPWLIPPSVTLGGNLALNLSRVLPDILGQCHFNVDFLAAVAFDNAAAVAASSALREAAGRRRMNVPFIARMRSSPGIGTGSATADTQSTFADFN